MKTLTYTCLFSALVGTLVLMSQMTSTGGHLGKGLIEQAIADFKPVEGRVYPATATSRQVACDHLALPEQECASCVQTMAL